MEDLEKREKQERNKGSRSIVLPIAAAVAILAAAAIAIVAWGGGRSRVMDRSEAMEHALSDAGLALADVTLTRQELQRDGGRNCYEIEFVSETHVYEYEIDAATGEVRGVSIHALGTEGATASSSQGQTGKGQLDAENGQSEPSGQQPGTAEGQPQPEGGQPEASGQQSQSEGDRPEASGQQSQSEGDRPEASGQQPPTAGQTNPQSRPAGAVETIDAAKAAALADAGLAESDVTFTKEKLDWDDGIAVYDIEFLTADTEYDYEIDAATGAVLDKSAELLRPNESPGQAIDAGIGVESAKEIAAAHAGLSKEEAFFTKAELELEHGRSEYEIEFYHDRIEYEYTIDAATGAILEYESEYDH
nr:PepSY domain-containing protein [uncultured Acetatifactor sp.]